MPKLKWVDFDKHPPGHDRMVYLKDDGTGKESGRMRIPCRYFDELRAKYPDLKIRYRSKSNPLPGDDVRFQYPINNAVDTGIVLTASGDNIMIAAEIMEGVTLHAIEVHRYHSEVTVLHDERWNEKYGR